MAAATRRRPRGRHPLPLHARRAARARSRCCARPCARPRGRLARPRPGALRRPRLRQSQRTCRRRRRRFLEITASQRIDQPTPRRRRPRARRPPRTRAGAAFGTRPPSSADAHARRRACSRRVRRGPCSMAMPRPLRRPTGAPRLDDDAWARRQRHLRRSPTPSPSVRAAPDRAAPSPARPSTTASCIWGPDFERPSAPEARDSAHSASSRAGRATPLEAADLPDLPAPPGVPSPRPGTAHLRPARSAPPAARGRHEATDPSEAVFDAIREPRVRGARAIGIAAAFGLALAMRTTRPRRRPGAAGAERARAGSDRATDRHQSRLGRSALPQAPPSAAPATPESARGQLIREAEAVLAEDLGQICRGHRRCGARPRRRRRVLTHATRARWPSSAWGTATAPIYARPWPRAQREGVRRRDAARCFRARADDGLRAAGRRATSR